MINIVVLIWFCKCKYRIEESENIKPREESKDYDRKDFTSRGDGIGSDDSDDVVLTVDQSNDRSIFVPVVEVDPRVYLVGPLETKGPVKQKGKGTVLRTVWRLREWIESFTLQRCRDVDGQEYEDRTKRGV